MLRLTASILVLGSVAARAQPPAPGAIEIASIRAMLARSAMLGRESVSDSAGKSVLLVNPFIASAGRMHVAEGTQRRSPDAEQAIARALGARFVRRDDAVRCTTGPRSCVLDGNAYLELSSPVVRGDTASIETTMSLMTNSARQPVARETVRFTLARDGSGWRVVRAEQLSIT